MYIQDQLVEKKSILGGVVDKTDFSPAWLKVFQGCNDTLPSWRPSVSIPMIYETKYDYERVPRPVAFRINAIRETFEETGLLLVTQSAQPLVIDNEWRNRVHDNPAEFLQLCLQLNLCPNIWALHEWSDWLTPLHLKTKSRFDTIFYIAVMESDQGTETTPTSDGGAEVSTTEFKAPLEALHQHCEKEIWLAPPQFLELSRLATFTSIAQLQKFAQHRALHHGIETWFPVMATCNDGFVALYPGDGAYPIDPDLKGEGKHPKIIDYSQFSMNDFAAETSQKNRMNIKSPNDCQILTNFKDPCGHVVPLDYLNKSINQSLL